MKISDNLGGGDFLTHTVDYADDIALIETSWRGMQLMTEEVETAH